MSLLALAALAVTTAATPLHSVDVAHRSSTYNIDYRASVETRARTIGMSAGTRPSSQRCVMTAIVSVDRVIADGEHQLRARLPGQKTFTTNVPGDCRSRDAQLSTLINQKSRAISAHLAESAISDREHALAAIDAAHHFAAN